MFGRDNGCWVHVAASGVGHLAVQIAKVCGAPVIDTASAAKHDLVRGLSADGGIDYGLHRGDGDLEW